MASVNKVIILGNLGDDPIIRYSQKGDAIANVSVATSEKWIDKETNEKKELTEWHKVVFYKKTAEIVDKYLKKGSSIYVEGKLQTRKWTDKNGIDRYTTEIVADKLQMVGSKHNEESDYSEKNKSVDVKQKKVLISDYETLDDLPF